MEMDEYTLGFFLEEVGTIAVVACENIKEEANIRKIEYGHI